MAGITSTGLGSGLNINSLVSQLVQAEQAPAVARLNRQEAGIQAKISSFGNFKSALSNFRDALSALKSPNNFQKLGVSSSDTTVLTASAASNADVGNYRIEVKQLAQRHALATDPAAKRFDSPDDALGTGELTIKFGTTDYNAGTDTYDGFVQNGDKGTLKLTIDSSNNTLIGVRDAINKAKAGVTAAIVNDGSNGYRLVLNSTDSGAKNSLQITGAGGDGGLSILNFNGAATAMQQTQEAKDAKVAINGLEVLSASNTVNFALKGVTLNLQQAQAQKIVDLSVTQDNADLTKSVDAFVKGFNDLVKTVNDLAGYDQAKKIGGILQADSLVRSSLSELRAALGKTVTGLDGSVKSLSDVGVRIQKDGTLSLDKTKFEQALSSDRDTVAAVFSVIGRPVDPRVVYLESTADTKAGTYDVNITQAATQAKLVGGTVDPAFGDGPPPTFAIDGNNDTFKIRVDGELSGLITLTQRNGYTGQELAAEIQSRINGDSVLKAKGISVSVSYDSANRKFEFQSKSYGSSSKIQIAELDPDGGSGTLGLSLGPEASGLDVAGTIGGVAAEGKGQELKAIGGDAKGLKLQISDIGAGNLQAVKFSRGLVEQLDKTLTKLLENKGSIATRTEGLQKDLEGIQKQRELLDKRMGALEKRLLERFNAMDALLGRMQATGNYLSQQLANLPFSNKNKN